MRFVLSRAKVESRNNLETYLYNLKSSYEDSLKEKIPDDDLEELKSSVEAGLEVDVFYYTVFYVDASSYPLPPPPFPPSETL